MTPRQEFYEREEKLYLKALELVKDQPPQFNLAPIVDLVRMADGLGFDVVRRVTEGDAQP